MELLPGPMALRWWNRFDPTRRSYIFPPFYTLKYETACRRVISSCWNQKNGQWIETTTTRKRKKNEREREKDEKGESIVDDQDDNESVGTSTERWHRLGQLTKSITRRERGTANDVTRWNPPSHSLFLCSVCVCVYVTHPDESIQ